MERFLAFIKQHRWTVGLAAYGLLIAILMLTINFWRTLLILLFTGAGFLIGWLMDRGGAEAVKEFFQRLFKKGGGA